MSLGARTVWLQLICLFLLSTSFANAAPNISNVQATHVTLTGADITWNTTEPATSQVIVTSGPGDDFAPLRSTVEDPALVLLHSHSLTELQPSTTYWVYAVSRDASGNAASTIQTNISFTTPQAPTTGAIDYRIYTLGPKKVYAGSDLYFQMFSVRTSGAVDHLYFPAVTGLPPTITPHLICRAYSPLDDGSEECFSENSVPFAWGGNDSIRGEPVNVRLRTDPNTPPGNYTVTIQTRSGSAQQTVSYTFAVEQRPVLSRTPVVSTPPIPGLAKWESTMVSLGKQWCNPTQVFSFGTESQVWYYDGARVYFQIADYTGDSSFLPCARNILSQYRDNVISRNGGLQGWRAFPHGLSMDYWRTAEPSSKTAVDLLHSGNPWVSRGGSLDPYLMREASYALEIMVKYEQLTGQRDWHLTRTADYLLGDIDMLTESNIHGFQQSFFDGLLMEALIQYYELTEDPRVPPRIKQMLDWIWTTSWNKDTHKLQYNPLDIPSAYDTVSINLVVPAFAWYWQLSGDNTYLSRGDEMFLHALDEDISYSGKIFSQNFRWSFDYVRWRRGAKYSTSYPDSNNPLRSNPPIADIQASATAEGVAVSWLKPTRSAQLSLKSLTDETLASDIFFSQTQSPSISFTGLQADQVYRYMLQVMGESGDMSTAQGVFQTLARPASAVTWALSSAMYRIPFKADSARTFIGAPILVDITLSSLLPQDQLGHVTTTDGTDLVFVDAAGNLVPEDRRLYDPTTGHLISWIQLQGNTDFFLYIGAPPGARRSGTGADVWDSDFAAVWHLDTQQGKVSGEDGTNRSPGTVKGNLSSSPGMVGGGIHLFYDNTQYVDIPESTPAISRSAFTLETWIQPASTNESQRILSNFSGDTLTGYELTVGDATKPVVSAVFGTRAGYAGAVTVDPLPMKTWSYVAATYDGVNVRIYVNGQAVALRRTGLATGPIQPSELPTQIGRSPFVPSYAGAMDLDEVRISTVVRSQAWIQAQYNNFSSPGLLSSGETEVRPVSLGLRRRR